MPGKQASITRQKISSYIRFFLKSVLTPPSDSTIGPPCAIGQATWLLMSSDLPLLRSLHKVHRHSTITCVWGSEDSHGSSSSPSRGVPAIRLSSLPSESPGQTWNPSFLKWLLTSTFSCLIVSTKIVSKATRRQRKPRDDSCLPSGM